MSVIDEIAVERRRQVEVEGWTPEHDDKHDLGQLAEAAICYAKWAPDQHICLDGDPPEDWPWSPAWWKRKGRRRDLIRAAALLIAEIERLDRLS